MTTTNVIRPFHIAENIVFLDGLTGTGKTMMAPLLTSFARVELGRFDHIHEYLCALNAREKIEPDAASILMNIYADLALYNSMIARETNFRWSDLSGVFSNPKTFTYLKRLWYHDGKCVEKRIKEDRPIFQIISHQMLPNAKMAFSAFNERIRMVEMVRHPLYLFEHWHSYIERFGTDPRDFTVCIEYNGRALPWFALGWEEKYLTTSSYDKVVYAIQWLTHEGEHTLNSLSEKQRAQVLVIPFEKFVLDPYPFLGLLEGLLGTTRTTLTSRVLQDQKCPRKQVTAGPDKAIYKRYAWTKPDSASNDQTEFKKKQLFVENLISADALIIFKELCHEYELKHGLWF